MAGYIRARVDIIYCYQDPTLQSDVIYLYSAFPLPDLGCTLGRMTR